MLALPVLVSVGIGLSENAAAEACLDLRFDSNWIEHDFQRKESNDYEMSGSQLFVTSNGTASLIFRAVPKSEWNARSAKWSWSVSQSVIATDLTQKGADDRNLAIYFIFTNTATAESLTAISANLLLKNKKSRVLGYVWGGSHARGTVLPSPYDTQRLKMIIRQAAGTGEAGENVDLVADFKKVFGESPDVLVGIGVFADSDATDGNIAAVVEMLSVC